MTHRTFFSWILVFSIVSFYVLWSDGHPWVGEWNWTIDTIVGTTALTGPLVAAMAAWLGMTSRRLEDLWRAIPRGWLVPAICALKSLVAASIAFMIVSVVGLVVTWLSFHGGRGSWWALILGFSVLLIHSGVGAALGYLYPRWITVALIGPGVFMIAGLAPAPFRLLMRQGPETGSLAGLDFSLSVAALTVLSAVGIGLAAPFLATRAYGRSPLVLGALFAGLGAVACVPLALRGEERLVPVEEPADMCGGSRPMVCVPPSHAIQLEGLTRDLNSAAESFKKWGLKIPQRFDEYVPYQKPDPDHGLIIEYRNSSGFDRGSRALVFPRPCSAWFNPSTPPPTRIAVAQDLIIAVIGGRSTAAFEGLSPFLREWVMEGNRATQREWVQATYNKFATCEFDKITLPKNAT